MNQEHKTVVEVEFLDNDGTGIDHWQRLFELGLRYAELARQRQQAAENVSPQEELVP